MQKFLLAFALFTFPFSFGFVDKSGWEEKVQNTLTQTQTEFVISKNPDFSSQDVNFSSGEEVFVKVSFGSDRKANAILTLLDSSKNKLLEISMTKSGNDYSGSFKAPQEVGVYYVHVELKGDGLSFSGEKNINIQKTENSDSSITTQNVKSEAKAVVNDKNVERVDDHAKVEEEGSLENSAQAKFWLSEFIQKIRNWLVNLVKSIGS